MLDEIDYVASQLPGRNFETFDADLTDDAIPEHLLALYLERFKLKRSRLR